MASTFLSLLLIFSLLSVSSAQTLTRAAALLSNSSYPSMSLALRHLIASLNSSAASQPPSITVFAPSDAVFNSLSGEPSLDLILFQLVPAVVPLGSLPLGATVPTLLRSHSLTVTAVADGRGLLCLNHVTFAYTPLHDSDDLVIFAVDAFFRRNFTFSAPPRNPSYAAAEALSEASEVLKSYGFNSMAAFLDLHFLHDVGVYDSKSALTVFAPVDRAMKRRLIGDPSRHASTVMLRRHVVPWRLLSYTDLESLEEGSQLMTSDLQGATSFVIKVTHIEDEDVVVLNGVPVIAPEIYNNGWLVIHGVGEALDDQQRRSGGMAALEAVMVNFRNFVYLVLSIHYLSFAYLKFMRNLLYR